MFDSYVNRPDQAQSTAAMFLINQKNEAFARGRADKPVREWRAAGCLLLFLVPFIIAGLGIGGWAFVQWRDWLLLSRSGVNTTGYFTDRSISEGDDSTNYYASYRYVVDDLEYVRKDQVSYALYSRVEAGASTNVLYYTGDPNIATLDLDGGGTLRIILTVFALIWNFVIGLLVVSAINMAIRNVRLARAGRLLYGAITTIQGHEDSDNDYQIEIKYTFGSPISGQQIEAKHKFQDNSRKRDKLPKPGTRVAVLFLDDKTYRLL